MPKSLVLLVLPWLLAAAPGYSASAQDTDVYTGFYLYMGIGGDVEGPDLSYSAVEALGAIGAPALPELRRLLHSANPQAVNLAASGLAIAYPASKDDLPLVIAALAGDDGSNIWPLSHAVGRFGIDAAPALVKMLAQDDAQAERAAMALSGIPGPPAGAVQALIGVLRQHGPQARAAAVQCLASYGPEAAEAIPQLLEVLADSDENIASQAGYAIAEIKAQPGVAVPYLMALLKEHGQQTPYYVIDALVAYGEDAAGAIPYITRMISSCENDASAGIFVEALNMLGAPSIPAYIGLAGEARPGFRQWAAIGLGRVGAGSAEACNAVLALLNDREAMVRIFAAQSLGEIQADPAVAVPALAEALGDTDPEVRRCAARALSFYGHAALDAYDELAIAYVNGPLEVKTWVAEALGQIGPDAAAACQLLAGDLAADDSGLIATALVKMGAEANLLAQPLLAVQYDEFKAYTIVQALAAQGTAAIGILTAIVDNGTGNIRYYAIAALGQLGAAASAAVPVLQSCCGDRDPAVAMLALQALHRITGSMEQLSDAVQAGLAAHEPGVQCIACSIAAAEQLSQPEIITGLRHALSAGDYVTSAAALQALTALGPASAPAIPELAALVESAEAWGD